MTFQDSLQNLCESPKPIIAVCMATSRQGMSVVRHLSESGTFFVRAITRNPYSKKACILNSLPNVQIVAGDLLDKESLYRCLQGVYGIFGNTTPTKGWVIGRGSMVPKYELEQGKNLIDVICEIVDKDHTLNHFIFSSVCKAKEPINNNPVPSHFQTKWNIEDHISKTGLKELTTFLRPASYFENFNSDLPGIKISNLVFPGIVHPEKKWQTIAVDDVGQWANACFNFPDKFIGKGLNIAGEELTGNEMAELLQEINSKKTKYYMLPRTLIKLLEHDIAVMADWIERAGYGADIEKLKCLADEVGINITSLSSWLKKNHLNNNPTNLKNMPFSFILK